MFRLKLFEHIKTFDAISAFETPLPSNTKSEKAQKHAQMIVDYKFYPFC